MGLGKNLEKILKEQDRTVAWLAKKINCDRNYIYNFIRQDCSRYKRDFLVDISKALDVPMSDLLGLGNSPFIVPLEVNETVNTAQKALKWLGQPGIQATGYGISDETTRQAVDMLCWFATGIIQFPEMELTDGEDEVLWQKD